MSSWRTQSNTHVGPVPCKVHEAHGKKFVRVPMRGAVKDNPHRFPEKDTYGMHGGGHLLQQRERGKAMAEFHLRAKEPFFP